MSSWKEFKLGDIINFGNGRSRPKIEGEYPIYGGNGILGYANEFNYTDETIILGRVGAYCGSVYYENKPIWVSDNALSAKPKEGNHSKFLYYFLKNMDLNSHAGGSSHPLITQSLLNSLNVEICTDFEEQKVIAEVLSSLDDKIDLLHRQNQTLESLAQTIFRQWFIEEAKEEWEIKFFDTPIQIIDGDRGNNYPKNSDFFTNEYCLFLSARNVTKNGFDFSDCQFITKERDELLRKGKLSRNDVVLTTRGTVGNIAYYHELIPFENIRINSGMVILRVDETKISSLYLYILMKTPLFTESVIEHTSGSAQPQLPIRDLNNVSFILPPEDIYNKFMEQVKPIYSKVFSNQKQIQTLENLRDTLLPKLLSGEVRIVL